MTHHDPDLLRELETLVDPVTRGDPMSPLRWTCKSADKLAEGLRGRGHVVSERTVDRRLHDLGYSLQSNRKTIEGRGHPDRDAQFQYINRRAKAFQRQDQPVISVDIKKKELVGAYREGGREWQPKGKPMNGGLFGPYPDLTHLKDGDSEHEIDFRRVYAIVLERWLGRPAGTVFGASIEPLPLFRS